jgi:hypothetical protein
MAGDNNLEGEGYDDLKEMRQVGSAPAVNVLVQFDTEENKTTRYRVEKNKLTTLKVMPGVNAGDPKVLTDFLKWGATTYPAEHYLVDVWNHGGGWENLPSDYDYDSIRSAKPQRAARLMHLKRALFRTTVGKIHQRPPTARAIAIDCGSHDYLDNQELRKALTKARPGGRKFDILGCDACLMNMLEIGYEMKDTAAYLVGSEETEPGVGWPYAAILAPLVKTPGMAPQDLAKLIVTEYGKWYRKNREAATQSALDPTHIQPVAEAVNALAEVLLANLKAVAGDVSLSRDKAQKFEMPEYLDLGDFCRQLRLRLPQNPTIVSAADRVLSTLAPVAGGGFVVQNVAVGTALQRATGVSIYFPHPEDYAPDYKSLRFSKAGHWQKFLKALFEL